MYMYINTYIFIYIDTIQQLYVCLQDGMVSKMPRFSLSK